MNIFFLGKAQRTPSVMSTQARVVPVQNEFSKLFARVSNINSSLGPRNLNLLDIAETENRQIFYN